MSSFKFAIGRPFTPDVSTATVAAGREGDFIRATSTTSSDSETGYDSDWAINEHMNRVWRADNSAGDKDLDITLSTSSNPEAILVEGLNVSSIDVGSTVSLTTYAVEQCARTGRGSRLIEAPTQTASVWRFRVNRTDVFDSNHDYAEIGRISFVKANSLTTMTTDWGEPYTWNVKTLGAEREFPGGLVETTSTSQQFIQFSLQGLFDQSVSGSYTSPFRYVRMLSDERVLHWEDRDDDTNNTLGFMCRRQGDAVVTQEYPYYDIDVNIVEVL